MQSAEKLDADIGRSLPVGVARGSARQYPTLGVSHHLTDTTGISMCTGLSARYRAQACAHLVAGGSVSLAAFTARIERYDVRGTSLVR